MRREEAAREITGFIKERMEKQRITVRHEKEEL